VNQDILGRPAQRLTNVLSVDIWIKKTCGQNLLRSASSIAQRCRAVNLVWHDLGLRAKPAVRDLWLRKRPGPAEEFCCRAAVARLCFAAGEVKAGPDVVAA